MDAAFNIGVDALASIAALVLVALGLAIIFGMMGVINMAHGEFVMIGAVTAVFGASIGIPFALTIPIAAIIVGLFGALVERFLIRYLYGRGVESTLLATFGLSLILQQAAVLTIGNSHRGLATPLGNFKIGAYSIGWYQLALIAAALAVVAIVLVIFLGTTYGLNARATMQNRRMATSLGVRTQRVNTITFALGSATAGAAGAIIAPTVAVVPSMGVPLISTAFLTVIVGGPASVSGSAAAGGILGFVQASASYAWSPIIGTSALLVAAMLILRVRPNGISSRWKRTL
jgi:branched-subunit amino acid ABC-type transport system permease component